MGSGIESARVVLPSRMMALWSSLPIAVAALARTAGLESLVRVWQKVSQMVCR